MSCSLIHSKQVNGLNFVAVSEKVPVLFLSIYMFQTLVLFFQFFIKGLKSLLV